MKKMGCMFLMLEDNKPEENQYFLQTHSVYFQDKGAMYA